MLKLYHFPISPNSRRVWITLIEKGLDVELVELDLRGEQSKPEFLAINPFKHIPVLVDDGFNVVESLAILDYLEAKYPTPAMLPTDAKDLGIVKMVEMVSANELFPTVSQLMPVIFNLPTQNEAAIEQAKIKISTVLQFFEGMLDQRPYFGSNHLTLADIVAGTIVPMLLLAGISLDEYPKVKAWCDRLIARPSWTTTQASPEAIEGFKQMLMARSA
ncbi:MAG: glutathione S-transferase family protein [Nostocales cyanobacterium ELA583]|jgi:glutathione S-transferase